jgi:hypothetical protein
LRKKKYPESTTDRQAIESLKTNDKMRDRYFERMKMDRHLQVEWEALVKELNNTPLVNETLGNNYHNRWDGKIRDTNDWGSIVEFWYTVRNNLFHGTKSPEVFRDKSMVMYAYKTIKDMVDIFISELDYKSFKVQDE